jgi:hypothetical protein
MDWRRAGDGDQKMLTFDLSFHSDGVLGCVLWADQTAMGRVRLMMPMWHCARRSGPESKPRADGRSPIGQVRA